MTANGKQYDCYAHFLIVEKRTRFLDEKNMPLRIVLVVETYDRQLCDFANYEC